MTSEVLPPCGSGVPFTLCAELQHILDRIRLHNNFNPSTWIQHKVSALNAYMTRCHLQGCVVNVSGGIDSALVLFLCCRAKAEKDSPIQRVIGICQPIESSTWSVTRGIENIKACGAEALIFDQGEIFKTIQHELTDCTTTLCKAHHANHSNEHIPYREKTSAQIFADGQLKSYLRTPAVYYVAQLFTHVHGIASIVMGTGNLDEDGYLGYFCKAGDGVVDVQLISDLHKSQVYLTAQSIGVPVATLMAKPSADLWPGQTDEDELGFPYDFVELYSYLQQTPQSSIHMTDDTQNAVEGMDAHTEALREDNVLASLSLSAREEYEMYKMKMESVHRRNAHKLKNGGIVHI